MNAGIIDEDSPFLFDPDLTDEYDRALTDLFDDLVRFPKRSERIVKRERDRVDQSLAAEPSKGRTRYLAVLEVLTDLIEINYRPGHEDGQRVVYPPDSDRFSDNPQQYKEFERNILKKEQEAQFREDSIRRFIREMETPDRYGGEVVSIESLICDGQALYEDLVTARETSQSATADNLADAVQPYVQVVVKGEDDPHTGLDLMDIWRYFRYTWLTPYNTVPGRNINFLIRDAARDHHPVMGIAALASPMMNLGSRDDEIGWTYEGLEEKLQRKQRILEYEEPLPKDERSEPGETRTRKKTDYLETEDEYQERRGELCQRIRPAVEDAIDDAIDRIKYDDFIDRVDQLTEESFAAPTDADLAALKRLEGIARYVLKDRPASDGESGFDPAKYNLTWDELASTEIRMQDDDPDDLDSWAERSETALFIRKRAENLAKLLREKQYINEHSDEDDVTFIDKARNSEAGTRVLKTGLKEIKKRRVGSAMMNIQVCGAIPPYNHILGGKLVAMALTGPEIINVYKDKYEGQVSKIASSMAGEAVEKPAELVLLDTTSLFGSGSAQYDRVRVPTPEGQIEYEEIGKTSGYGSIQFGARTRELLVKVTQFAEGQKVVKSRFGEGVAPRMRKIRNGLENLGLSGDLLRHESPRIVYNVELATDAFAYLRGETDTPTYYWDMETPDAGQQSIYDHWRHRWVSKRVQKDNKIDPIREFDARKNLLLGPQIEFEQQQITDF